MKTIYKYKLEPSITGYCTIEMPKDAQILSVQLQKGECQLWAIVNNRVKKEERYFWVIGTGWDLDDLAHSQQSRELKYIGTVQDLDLFVWHIFEEPQDGSE